MYVMPDHSAQCLKNEALLSYVMCLSHSDEVIAVEPGVVTVATGCCAGCVCV